MKKVMIILLMALTMQTFAGTSKNRPTMPRDPKATEMRPKRGNAPWPIPG